MSFPVFTLLLCSIGAVPVYWILHRAGFEFIAEHSVYVLTFLVLYMLSPMTALWVGATAVIAPVLMLVGDRFGCRGMITLMWLVILVSVFEWTRHLHEYLWIGFAYFTLRHVHVLIDWWTGRGENPGIIKHMQYQLFLPVMIAGPIHRYPHFRRQLARRHWDTARFYTGAERALFGIGQAVIFGEYMMVKLLRVVELKSSGWENLFLIQWLTSALEWVQLFLIFSGINAAAIGISLMLGIRIEENFNRPWRARHLLDFWARWHMTLSSFCRDYVFQPVLAVTRSPVLGVLTAMLAMGLWHGTSLYFLVWGVWQALGIIVTHVVLHFYGLIEKPKPIRVFLNRVIMLTGPLLVLAWLSFAQPLIGLILK